MWHVTLFGKFRASFGSRLVEIRDGSKAQELFTYLLLHRRRPVTREVLASLLWGERSTRRSKAYLRKALWQLQLVLDSCSQRRGQSLVCADAEWVELNPAAELWLDTRVLEDACMRTHDVRGAELTPSDAQELSCAVELYQGDLLENQYLEWCLVERERLKHMYLIALEKLMERSEQHAHYEAGLCFGMEILRHDTAREHIHRGMMRLHYLRGDRSSAVKQFRDCVAVLEHELGIAPTEATSRLFEAIREGAWHPSPVTLDTGKHVSPQAIEAIGKILSRLRDLHAELDEIQHATELLGREFGPTSDGGAGEATIHS